MAQISYMSNMFSNQNGLKFGAGYDSDLTQSDKEYSVNSAFYENCMHHKGKHHEYSSSSEGESAKKMEADIQPDEKNASKFFQKQFRPPFVKYQPVESALEKTEETTTFGHRFKKKHHEKEKMSEDKPKDYGKGISDEIIETRDKKPLWKSNSRYGQGMRSIEQNLKNQDIEAERDHKYNHMTVLLNNIAQTFCAKNIKDLGKSDYSKFCNEMKTLYGKIVTKEKISNSDFSHIKSKMLPHNNNIDEFTKGFSSLLVFNETVDKYEMDDVKFPNLGVRDLCLLHKTYV